MSFAGLLSTPVFIGAGLFLFICAMIWPERARLAFALVVSLIRHVVKILRGKDDQAPAPRRASNPDLAGTISQPIKLPDHLPSIPKHSARHHVDHRRHDHGRDR